MSCRHGRTIHATLCIRSHTLLSHAHPPAACGLYYLAELVEEHTAITRRIMYGTTVRISRLLVTPARHRLSSLTRQRFPPSALSQCAVLASHVFFLFETLPYTAIASGVGAVSLGPLRPARGCGTAACGTAAAACGTVTRFTDLRQTICGVTRFTLSLARTCPRSLSRRSHSLSSHSLAHSLIRSRSSLLAALLLPLAAAVVSLHRLHLATIPLVVCDVLPLQLFVDQSLPLPLSSTHT